MPTATKRSLILSSSLPELQTCIAAGPHQGPSAEHVERAVDSHLGVPVRVAQQLKRLFARAAGEARDLLHEPGLLAWGGPQRLCRRLLRRQRLLLAGRRPAPRRVQRLRLRSARQDLAGVAAAPRLVRIHAHLYKALDLKRQARTPLQLLPVEPWQQLVRLLEAAAEEALVVFIFGGLILLLLGLLILVLVLVLIFILVLLLLCSLLLCRLRLLSIIIFLRSLLLWRLVLLVLSFHLLTPVLT
mmetsp:Transcript_106451/g.311212  ORF Transcript_106451/g.311212 Transcript_106451/m.311212 type:complete len:243 (+) Transcript_106451:97-825(+)